MPYKEKPLTRKYYTIGEVANMFNMATSAIRFWQAQFPQLRPKRGQRNKRKFTAADIAIIAQIHHLVKEKGHTLEGARRQLALMRPHSTTGKQAVIDLLERMKNDMQRMIALLDNT